MQRLQTWWILTSEWHEWCPRNNSVNVEVGVTYMIRRAGTLHARCSSTIAGADQRSMVHGKQPRAASRNHGNAGRERRESGRAGVPMRGGRTRERGTVNVIGVRQFPAYSIFHGASLKRKLTRESSTSRGVRGRTVNGKRRGTYAQLRSHSDRGPRLPRGVEGAARGQSSLSASAPSGLPSR